MAILKVIVVCVSFPVMAFFSCGVWQRMCQCLARAAKIISCCLKQPVLLVRWEHSSESSVTRMRRCTHFRRKADEEGFLSTPVTHSRHYRFISPSHVAFILLDCIKALQMLQIGMYYLTSGVGKRPTVVTSFRPAFSIAVFTSQLEENVETLHHWITSHLNVTSWDCKVC